MVKVTNPLNDTQFDRLTKSIDWSNKMLTKPRENRLAAIRQYVGYHYMKDGSEKRVIVPFLKMAIDIHVRLLAARSPRALFSTMQQDLKWTAANLELAVNQIPPEIKFEVTLKQLVLEALFGVSVAKVGLHTVGNILGHEYGAPFVDVIPLDDLVIDMAARHIDLIQYMGNDYWLNYEDVMESETFKGKGREELAPDDFTVQGEAGEKRAESISVIETAELFKKKVWLRDVWIPSEKLMVTYSVKDKHKLRVVEWEGPERGPYPILSFGSVPGNLLPIPPVSAWRDLHELKNALYRKLGDQADAQKTVQGFPGGEDDAVLAFKGCSDGGGISFPASQAPIQLKAGGIDQSTLAFFEECKNLGSYYAGNLDALGGLSPQSKTLGQDKLISEASGAQIREMAASVVKFAQEIFTHLAWYEWHDPVRRRNLKKAIPGTDLEIVVPWDQKSRRGNFDLYDMEIDVFSLQDDSPNAKWMRLLSLLKEVIFPLEGAIQQAGGTLDVKALAEMGAKWQDIPELSEIVKFIDQPEMAGSNKSVASMQNTVRQTERINRPGVTEQGRSAALQKVLLGGRPQKDEMAQIGQPTG